MTSKRVLTNEGIRSEAPPSAAPKTAPAPSTAVPAVAPVVDPAKKFAEELEKTRVKMRDLQSQEAVLQLQVNDLNSQFFAPVTDQAAKAAAQTQITAVQTRLAGVRDELAATRIMLQQMEARGPAK